MCEGGCVTPPLGSKGVYTGYGGIGILGGVPGRRDRSRVAEAGALVVRLDGESL